MSSATHKYCTGFDILLNYNPKLRGKRDFLVNLVIFTVHDKSPLTDHQGNSNSLWDNVDDTRGVSIGQNIKRGARSDYSQDY